MVTSRWRIIWRGKGRQTAGFWGMDEMDRTDEMDKGGCLTVCSTGCFGWLRMPEKFFQE